MPPSGENERQERPDPALVLVAEVQFAEWTDDGQIRHPSLQGFRANKRPINVRRELAE